MNTAKPISKRILSFLLALALLITLVPVSVFAEDGSADPIAVGQADLGLPISVSSDGEEVLFSFTPAEDGYFRARFDTLGGLTSIVTLYSADMQSLAQNDFDLNAELDFELTGGQSYYYGVTVLSGSEVIPFNGSFTLKEMVWITFHANSEVNPTAFIYGENAEKLETVRKLYDKGSVFPDDMSASDETNDFWEMGWSVDPAAADADPEIIFDSAKDLYAVWISSEITITFYANGGYFVDPITHENVEQRVHHMSRDYITKPVDYFESEPKHDRFMIFDGWYSDPEAGEPVTEISLREDSTDVYAHWIYQQPVAIEQGQEIEITYPGDGCEILLCYTPSSTNETLAFSLTDSTDNPGLSGASVQVYDGYMQPLSYTGQFRADGFVIENIRIYKFTTTPIYIGISIPQQYAFSFRALLDEQPKVAVNFHSQFSFCYITGKDEFVPYGSGEINTYPHDYTSYQYLHSRASSSSIRAVSDDERYTFLGWSTDPDALEPESVESIVLEGEIDLYPVWTIKHQVVFHINHEGSCFGENTGITEITTYYDDGSWFVGNTTQWWDSASESFPFAHIDSSLGRPSTVLGLSEDRFATVPDKLITIDSDKDLYVVWGSRVSVTFDINIDPEYAWYYSGSEKVSTRTEALTPTESIADYVRARTFDKDNDVRFLGWSDDPDATEPNPDLEATAGLKVYGVWQKRFFYITYDVNDDDAYLDSDHTLHTLTSRWIKTKFEDSPTFRTHTVFHTNKFATFLGWYDDPVAGKLYEEYDSIPDGLTVYGHWLIRTPVEFSEEEWVEVDVTEQELLYSFTPEETAEYRFFIDYGNSNNYISKTLYDSGMHSINQIGSPPVYTWYGSAKYPYSYADLELTEGETCYLGVRNTLSEDSAPFRIRVFRPQKINITFEANNPSATFHVGTDYVTSYTKVCTVGEIPDEWLTPQCDVWEYQFIGWSKDPNAFDPDENLIIEEGDTTIYAVWEYKFVNITLHANDESAVFIVTDNETGLQKEVPETTLMLDLGETWKTDYFPKPKNNDSGRILLGWSETPDGPVLPEEITISKYKTDYYAVWTDLPSGTCGDALTWELKAAAYGNDRYDLVIKGTGDMADYESMEETPWYAFRDKICSVTLQEGITSVGQNAFHGCSRITRVSLPDTLTRIRNYAFSGCSAMQDILLPTALEDLGLGAFESCTNLVSLYIPYNVKEIPSWLCRNCTNLRSFETPVEATRIGIDAFKGCTSLASIRMTDTVRTIGDGAFDGTDNLKSIRLSRSLQTEDGSFGISPERIAGLTVYGYKGQPSEKLVLDNGGTYVYILGQDCEVTLPAGRFDYTGQEVRPKPVVKFEGEILTEETDYTIKYYGNVEIGWATMEVIGIGKYAESIYRNFEIIEPRPEQTLTVSASSFSLAVGKYRSITVSSSEGALSYAYASGSSTYATVARTSTGYKITAKKVGTVKIRITAAETANYKAKSATITVKIVPAATTSLTASAASTGVKLTWKKVTGATGYTVYRGSTQLKKITSAATLNYTDTKAANGTTYTYKVVPYASTGNGTAKSVKTTFVSRPTPRLTTTAKKLTVKWSRNTKANGYEIWYGTNKSFKSGTYKKYTASKNTIVSKTFTAVSGKTYYVKIRTYKTVSGKKVYSAWSAVKYIKVK